MKKNLLRVIIWIAVIAAAAVIYAFLHRGPESSSRSVTGIIDGTEVNLSSKVAGRIAWVCCSEGDTIQAGQKAIELESADLRASADQAAAGVEKTQADIATFEASAESAEAGIRNAEAEIKSSEADLERARVLRDEAKREAERARELFRKDFISRESMDQAVANFDSAAAQVSAAEARVHATRSRRDAAAAQLRTARAQIRSASSGMKQARAALAFAQSKFADTAISSPVSGTVIFKSLEQGENVNPGSTILTVVDLNSLYVRVDIDEARIGWVTLGSPATIAVTGMPGKTLSGRVVEIGRYGEFATQRDVPRGRQDIKTFRVKVRVEDRSGILKPGMTVEVSIKKAGEKT